MRRYHLLLVRSGAQQSAERAHTTQDSMAEHQQHTISKSQVLLLLNNLPSQVASTTEEKKKQSEAATIGHNSTVITIPAELAV